MNVDNWIVDLVEKRQPLPETAVFEICERLKQVFAQESNVLHLSPPVNVIGDVHGQFYDVLEIFKIGGYPPDSNYLFLGDYVDRGYYSVETISLLACFKLKYPDRVNLLRGNHESRAVTQVYGFYNECMRKYGNAQVWKKFTEMFDFITLSAVIGDSIFCLHGGLSPAVQSLDQIRVLDRFKEIPHEGCICDIMWSDPTPDRDDFMISPRGAGYTYGGDIVKRFNYCNGMTHILRAHQLCMEGYQVLFDDQLSTVWSAPNYCYRCGNLASILEVSDVTSLTRNFKVFSAAPSEDREVRDGIPGASLRESQYFL